MNKVIVTMSHYFVVSLSCLAIICTQAGMTMYTPSMSSLPYVFNTEYRMIAYTLTAYLLGYAIAVLFFGGISDQLGRKKGYILTTTIYIISSLLLAFTRSIYIFIIFRFLQGIGGGGCAIIARTSVRDFLEEKPLITAMSCISISFIVSMGIFQYIGGIIQVYANYKYDFIVMALLGLCVLMLVITKFDETYKIQNNKFKTTDYFKNYYQILKENYLFPIAIGGGLGYSILIVFNIIGIYYLQSYLKTSSESIGIIGICFSLAYLFGSILSSKLIKYFDGYFLIKMGRMLVLSGGILSGISASIFRISIFIVIFPLIITILGQALIYPSAMVKALLPYKNNSGTASSLFGFTQQFSGFLISVFVGWLPFSIVSLNVMVLIIGLMSFLFLSDRFLRQKTYAR